MKLIELMPDVTIEEVRAKQKQNSSSKLKKGDLTMKIRSVDVYILDLPTIRPHQLSYAYNC